MQFKVSGYGNYLLSYSDSVLDLKPFPSKELFPLLRNGRICVWRDKTDIKFWFKFKSKSSMS